MEFLLLGLLGAAGLAALVEIFDGGDAEEETPQTPSEPEDESPETPIEPEPEEDLDTGATVMENEDGSVEIELGEDETGSLTAIMLVQTSFGENWDNVYELGIFLVPEGVEIPLDSFGNALGAYSTPDELFEDLGLTELASFDLGTDPDTFFDADAEDTRVEPPEITANAPIDVIRLEYGYGDGGFSDPQGMTSQPQESFSPFEEPSLYFDGAAPNEQFGDYTGGAETDLIYVAQSTSGEGVLLDGGDGRDMLLTSVAESTLNGGDGNDIIHSIADGILIDGGNGDDILSAGSIATIHGGDGDDYLQGSSSYGGYLSLLDTGTGPNDPTDQLLSGDLGDDTIRLYGQSTGHGGEGDDRIYVRDQSLGMGESGDDYINIHGGGRGFGGAGDDTIYVGGAGSTAYGDDGDDIMDVAYGAQGFGGEGDDFITTESSGELVEGGNGNDTIHVSTWVVKVEPETTTLTGCDGTDEFGFGVEQLYESYSGQQTEIAVITDFVPGEDVITLQDNPFTDIVGVSVEEADDGSHSILTIEMTTDRFENGDPPAELTVRLEGVTGYSAEELVMTA